MTQPPSDNDGQYRDSLPHAGEGAESALRALLRKQRQKPVEPTAFQDTIPTREPGQGEP
jgi:hypothetical protein